MIIFWLFVTYVAFFAVELIYCAALAWIGVCCGVGVERISIGIGPTLFQKTIRSVEYRWNGLPVGGHTKFITGLKDPAEAADDIPAKIQFDQLPTGEKCLILLSGPCSSLFLGLSLWTLALVTPGSEVVINPAAPWPIVPSAVPGMSLTGKSTSISTAIGLLDDGLLTLWERIATFQSIDRWGGLLGWSIASSAAATRYPGAWITCIGTICIGHGLLNLLPILPLNGGMIVWTILEGVTGRSLEKLYPYLAGLGFTLLFVFFGRIIYCDLMWIRHWMPLLNLNR